jgi:hypothetical protein
MWTVATKQTTPLCSLVTTVGKPEACPEGACPFWEPGGAALGGRCAVEELGALPDVALATWLLEIRESLEAASSEEEEHAMRSAFRHLLNDSSE